MLEAIQQYDVIEKIGEGGMGVVYKALHRTLERPVAIKRLAPHLSKNQNMLDRFLKEARLQAKLSHPNVVNIFDLLEWMDDVYLVMEFVSGESVKDMIEASGRLHMPEALHIASGVLSGLHFMHDNNIVHRDIKPSNIIVSTSGQVKVTDFGIARLMEGDTGLTRFGAGVGTLKYMAPELLKSGEVSFGVDIYSMGITLYEMLGGSPPFQGDTDLEVMLGHIEKTPPPLELPDDEAGRACRDMVLKALSKSPAERFASAMEFLAEVKRAQTLLGIEGVTPGPLKKEPTRTVSPGPKTGEVPGRMDSPEAPPAPSAAQTDATMIGEAPLSAPQATSHPPRKMNAGLLAGLAAAVVLAAGGYMFLGGKDSPAPPATEHGGEQARKPAAAPADPARSAESQAPARSPEAASSGKGPASVPAAPGQESRPVNPSQADASPAAPASPAGKAAQQDASGASPPAQPSPAGRQEDQGAQRPDAVARPQTDSAPAQAVPSPSTQPQETAPRQADTPKVLFTQSKLVRLRSAPDLSGSIRASLEMNTRLDVTGIEGDWAKVTTPQGVSGYVSLSQTGPEPAQTSGQAPDQAAPRPAAKSQGKKSSTGGDKGWRIVK